MSNVRFRTRSPNGHFFDYLLSREIDAGIHLDVYRLIALYEYDENGAALHGGSSIVNVGQWEPAGQVEGEGDYVGGYHGYEELSEAWGEAKGRRVDLTAGGSFDVTSFFARQWSMIYDLTATADLCRKLTEWHATADRLRISCRMEWQQSVTMHIVSIAMCPILRTFGAEQITDTASRSPSYADEDVHEAGFTQVFTDATTLRIRGAMQSGIHMEQKIVTWPTGITRAAWVSNAVQYNKLYHSCHVPVAVSAGDVWESVVEYRITSEA